jgi:serine/threonine-protein phosphatase PGAM5
MIGSMLSHLRRISPENGRILVSGLVMGAAFGCKSNLSIEKTRTQAVEGDNDEQPTAPLFYGECTASLVHRPKAPYPAWDYNWDHRSVGQKLPSTAPSSSTKTRHILLVRHGQYEQGFPDDQQQILTLLGRKQAEFTGQRLAKLMRPAPPVSTDSDATLPVVVPCRIKAIHVSGMARAKETAHIIASHLGGNGSVVVTDPDPLLNEALPAPIIPKRPDVGSLRKQQAEIRANQGRIEEAFQKYIHRAESAVSTTATVIGSTDTAGDAHEFEVIVCHGNVIRYFLMRALQLPPEAWLRFSVFNCSITYLMVQPNGYVTARLVGDTGHLSYEDTTFSGSHGYNWAAAPTST